MQPGKRKLSAQDVTDIVRSFLDLKVWWAGLHYGPIIYFDLGDQVRGAPFRGEADITGTGYLGIWAYDWRIDVAGEGITSGETVERAFMETEVIELVRGQEIARFALAEDGDEARVFFTNDVCVTVRYDPQSDREDGDLIHIHVPDGRMIFFSKQNGFYLSGDIDETLLLYWRAKGNDA